MLFNINSLNIILKNYSFLKFLFFKNSSKKKNIFFKKIYLNKYLYINKNYLNNYFFFFKNIFKINNFFFIKCVNLILYNYIYKYINIIFFLVKNNYNFYFLSKQFNFNLIWDLNIKYILKNLTKSNFMKFLINFLKKNKIKLIVYIDTSYLNLMNFFNKLNLLSAGLININIKNNSYNFPIFLNSTHSIYNTYFLYNVTYDIYLIATLYKYNMFFNKYFKNYLKLTTLKIFL